MQILCESTRSEFDKKAQSLLRESAENILLLRESLSALRPHELLRAWFGEASAPFPETPIDVFLRGLIQTRDRSAGTITAEDDIQATVGNVELRQGAIKFFASSIRPLRTIFSRRSLLFAWIYGPSKAVAELAYVRLPSSERRLLIRLLLRELRPKYPWLTGRLICAMAFRPQAFSTSHRPSGHGRKWGPLYRHVVLQQGAKRRYLLVPNPVLKRVQKSLLRLLQPGIDSSLHDSVVGARARRPTPIFSNASAHLHRKFIASFDIKDFFPATTVNELIRGLRHIATRTPKAVDPARRTLYPERLSSVLEEIAWTDDLRVFVVRLGTHRGRLPQGSPLSPLLANIAFSPFDDALAARFQQLFGRSKVKYTRYFDDLTISYLPSGGPDAAMTPAQFQSRCQSIIEDVLQNSPFRLNAKKSRASDTTDGHPVTGLIVRRRKINLPRHGRRELRSIIHIVQRQDFVGAARRWHQLEGRGEAKFESIRRGHRLAATLLRPRRMSAERLATLMLRQLYPDLRLHRILEDWHAWQEFFTEDAAIVTGKPMWPLVEWLLAARWTGAAHCERPTDQFGNVIRNRIVVRQRDVKVCELEAESSLDFFFLSRSNAIAATEYWHHLRGLNSFLQSCPQEEAFASIQSIAKNFAEAFAHIEVKASANEPEDTPEPAPLLPVSSAEKLDTVTNEFVATLREYLLSRDQQPGEAFGEACDVIRRRRATDWQGFSEWVSAAHLLTTGTLRKLPAASHFDDGIAPRTLYDYLRLRHDIDHNLRSGDYKSVQDFETKCKLGASTPPSHLMRMQGRIAESLTGCLRVHGRGTDRPDELYWLENHIFGDLHDRLAEQMTAFEMSHKQARSTPEVRRLFRRDTWTDVCSMRDAILEKWSAGMTSSQVWDRLNGVSKLAFVATVEAMEAGACTEEPPKEERDPENWRRKQLWRRSQTLIEESPSSVLRSLSDLRNRDAHGRSPERRDDWVGIQNKISRLLGRSWKSRSGRKHPTFSAPDDLILTAYEGQVVAVEFLLALNDWLRRVVDSEFWQPPHKII